MVARSGRVAQASGRRECAALLIVRGAPRPAPPPPSSPGIPRESWASGALHPRGAGNPKGPAAACAGTVSSSTSSPNPLYLFDPLAGRSPKIPAPNAPQ